MHILCTHVSLTAGFSHLFPILVCPEFELPYEATRVTPLINTEPLSTVMNILPICKTSRNSRCIICKHFIVNVLHTGLLNRWPCYKFLFHTVPWERQFKQQLFVPFIPSLFFITPVRLWIARKYSSYGKVPNGCMGISKLDYKFKYLIKYAQKNL